MKKSFSHIITQHPAKVISGIILLACFLLFGLHNLSFNIDYRIFFSDKNPELNDFKEIQNLYGSSDSIIFTIHNPNDDLFHEDIITDIQWLTNELKQIEYVSRVESIIDYPHIESEDKEIQVEPFLNEDIFWDEETLEVKKLAASKDSILTNGLISPQAETTLVNVIFNLPESSSQAVIQAANSLRELEKSFQQLHPELETGLSGVIMLNAAFGEAGIHDLTVLIPFSACMIFLGLMLIFRNIWIGMFSLFYIGATLILTLSVSSILGIPISVVSASSFIIILSLSIANCVHITNALMQQTQKNIPHNQMISDALISNMTPIFLTSLTTIASFLSLNFSDSPPYWHLGNMTAMGIFIAFILSLSLYPALLCLTKRVIDKPVRAFRPQLVFCSSLVLKYPRALIILLMLTGTVLIAGVSKIQFNDQFINYFSNNIDFRKDTEMLNSHIGGMYSIDYHIQAKTGESVLSTEYMNSLYHYTQWIRTQPETRYVQSLSDTMFRLYEHLDFVTTPNSIDFHDEDKNNQYFLIYELSLPINANLDHQLLVDKTGSKLTIYTSNLSSSEMQAFLERNRLWQEKNFPSFMLSQPSSPAVMFSYISHRNITSMLNGTLASLLMISILLLMLLKSVKLSMISLITNSLPILMMYGIAGYSLGELGMVGTTIAAATLGIVVDDTIHFLNKYQQISKDHQLSDEEAVEYTLINVGSAISSTTLILTMGMSVLLLSDFLLNYQAGLLTIITIILALIFDLLLLPAMILLSSGNNHGEMSRLKTSFQSQQV